ncbi:MAG: 3D domain-containing protein [Candidatus Latescibacterota bacterium]|nr:MAG: 3D domain-containing protein [Candidatus Latescibacterota bacterium]
MNSVDAPEVRERTAWRLNHFLIVGKNFWMTVILSVRWMSDALVGVPRTIRGGITPVRVVLAIVLAALVITPTMLYFVERTHHIETRAAFRALSVASASESTFLRSSLRELLDEQARLTSFLLESGNTVYSGDKVYVKVVATGYSSSIFETDATPFTTAANTQTRLGILALSRDLLSEFTPGAPFSFGDRVHLSGLGDFLVEDVMNARWSNRADVWFPSRGDALCFGARNVYLSRTLAEERDLDNEILTENIAEGGVPSGM